MTWPLSQDYNEAIQNPATAFADADLKAGTVAVNAIGLPIPRSGNFADVYQIKGADGKSWALKCFTRQVAGLQERYTAIDAHLRKVNLPFSVGFRFQPEGIRVKGRWYPMLKMEWVEGFTLNEFVRNNLAKNATLEALFQIWLRLSKRLRDADIAHADLQHGNVLLVPGAKASTLGLKLIDYDGMWVPALANKPSGELGHPAYQHPQRSKDRIYSKQVDRFPHLVIGTALLSLLVGGPDLWKKFDNGDNMLFREVDLRSPEQSALFKTLWGLGNPTLCHLLGQLALASWRSLNQSAWLDELMSSPQTLKLTAKQEQEVSSRLGVPPLSQPKTVAAAAAAPNVFADLRAERAAAGVAADEEHSPKLLWWLIGGAAAVLVLGVVSGIAAVALLAGGPAKTTPSMVQTNPTPTEPTPSTPVTSPTTTVPTPTKSTEPTPPTPPTTQTKPNPPPVIKQKEEAITLLWSSPGRARADCLEFTPDGQYLIAAPGDSSKWFRYDVNPDEKKIKEFEPGVTRFAQILACSDDSILTVSQDNSVSRWFTERGNAALKTVEPERRDPPLPFAVSPRAMVCCSVDPDLWGVRFYDLLNARRSPRPIEDRERERAIFLRYSPDGKQLAVVSRDFVVSIVSLATKSVNFDLKDPSRTVRRVAFSSDGNQLVGFGGTELLIWDLIAGGEPQQRYQPADPVNDAVFAPDGRVLFVCDDRMLRVWDPKTKREQTPIQLPQSASCVRVSPDGQFAATASAEGERAAIQLWRLAKPPAPPRTLPKWPYDQSEVGEVVDARSRSLDVPIRKVAIGDGGAKLYVATSDGKLRVFDAKTMEQTDEFALAKGGAVANFELLTETTVLAGEGGQPPAEWDVAGKKAVREFTGPVRPGYRRLLLSADKKVLAAHDEGVPATLWDVEQGKYLRAPAFPDTVDIALSADGKRLLAAGADDRLRLIDLTEGKVINTFADPSPESVSRLVFSPDGRKVAGGGKGGRISIWDVDTGRIVQQSSRFDGEVRDLAFTADDKKLIGVADADGVLVWDVAAKEELRFFPMRQGGVSVTITPDGKYAVTARAMDNVIQVWRLP